MSITHPPAPRRWWPAIGGAVIALGAIAAALRIRHLHHLAYTDDLTGLGNRRAALAAFERDPLGAVAVLDLDDFKDVNDAHGHAIGDHLLILVARRLVVALRGSGRAMRLGGDEFLILWTDPPPDLTDAGRAILQVVTAPATIAGITVTVEASIGLTCADSASGARALLIAADAAMYAAKRHEHHIAVGTPS
jgi:diguanylate cyclase (GGDEF)-like protein